MGASVIYIAIAIILLAAVVFLVFVAKREVKQNKLTRLAGLAFGFVVAGIIFGEEPVIGYTLMGIGVIFAIIDLFRKRADE